MLVSDVNLFFGQDPCHSSSFSLSRAHNTGMLTLLLCIPHMEFPAYFSRVWQVLCERTISACILVANMVNHLDRQSGHPRLYNCKQATHGLVQTKARLYAISVYLDFYRRLLPVQEKCSVSMGENWDLSWLGLIMLSKAGRNFNVDLDRQHRCCFLVRLQSVSLESLWGLTWFSEDVPSTDYSQTTWT